MKFTPLVTILLAVGAYYLGKSAGQREEITGMPVSPYMHLQDLGQEYKEKYQDIEKKYATSFYK